LTGYKGTERRVAWSAQGCCHGIQRKGEKSDLVSSRVLSWDTEERRDVLKREGHCTLHSVIAWAHGIQGKREKNGWGKLKSCCHGILRKGAKICIRKTNRVITGNRGKGRKSAAIRV
jgi:hypothetical protein